MIRQASVLVSVSVLNRFGSYQRQQAANGPRPTNTSIVATALNNAYGRYREIIAARQPQAEPGQLFGAPVPGRRKTTEATPRTQLAFRPTIAEMEKIKQLADEAGARSVSEFLNAVLDEFLPAASGRRSAGS